MYSRCAGGSILGPVVGNVDRSGYKGEGSVDTEIYPSYTLPSMWAWPIEVVVYAVIQANGKALVKW